MLQPSIVGTLRLERRNSAPKTDVLPLHHAPKKATPFHNVSLNNLFFKQSTLLTNMNLKVTEMPLLRRWNLPPTFGL